MTDNVDIVAGRIPFNAFLNALTTLLNAVVGLLTLPFLIDRLGAPTYGLWALIVAVSGYFLIFDSGFTGSVGRLVAGKRSIGDIEGLSAVVSTALIAALPLCGVIALAAGLVAIPFLWLFGVPVSQAGDVRMALLLVGFAMALSLPESIFYALLWGYERFDLQNFVEIGVAVVRTTMIFLFIDHQSSLLNLATIIVTASAGGFLVRAYLCWIAEPRLSVRPRHWSRDILSDLFVFGGWFALLRLSRSRLQDVATFVIGYLLGTVAVTTFTIPKMLTTYSGLLAQSVTQSVAPRAAGYHFGGQHTKQRDLFLSGGRYSLAISLYIFGGFVFLGLPFLSRWQSGSQGIEYRLLLILAVGEIVPLSQWVTYSAIVGIGKHRRLALLALCEGLCILVFSYLAVSRFGLVGAAYAVAACAFLFRGLLQCVYGCRLVNVSLDEYARQVALPIVGPAGGVILAAVVLGLSFQPRTWVELCVAMLLYTLIYWPTVLVNFVGWRNVLKLERTIFRGLQGGALRRFGRNAPAERHSSLSDESEGR